MFSTDTCIHVFSLCVIHVFLFSWFLPLPLSLSLSISPSLSPSLSHLVGVLSNLASCDVGVKEAPESSGKAHHPRRGGESSLMVLGMEGVVRAALDTMLDPFNGSNGSTLVAALECLNNMMCR